MNNRAELASKIADAIAQLMEHDLEDMEAEHREAEVRDRGRTRIAGQISGRRAWDSACIGSVEFCTNGPQGGDAGYGGFLRVTFRNIASTCMDVSVNDQAAQAADAVAITFQGDAEILACVESLEFLAAKLRAVAQLW
jgi:hypothetical protein